MQWKSGHVTVVVVPSQPSAPGYDALQASSEEFGVRRQEEAQGVRVASLGGVSGRRRPVPRPGILARAP